MIIRNCQKGLVPSKVEGFSLLETLLYISILVLLLGIIMSVTVSIMRQDRNLRSMRNIENSAVTSLERIVRETRSSESVDTISSAFGSTPGRLVLDGMDDSGNPRTVEFYVSLGQLVFRENGEDIGVLTGPEVNVVSLTFRYFTSGSAHGIRTEMALESGTSTHYRIQTFYASATLR